MLSLPKGSEKKRRPGSLVLQVFKWPRPESGPPTGFLHEHPAKTMEELGGLVRKRLRAGVDPRCMMMVRYDSEVVKIRWVPDEWKAKANADTSQG